MDFPLLLLIGFLAGVLGASMGLGGGILLIPALTLAMDVPIQVAIPVSLVAIVSNSAMTTLQMEKSGMIHHAFSLTLEITTILGVWAGVWLMMSLDPITLARIFGILVGLTAVWMLIKPLITGGKPKPPDHAQSSAETACETGPWSGQYRDLGDQGRLKTYVIKKLPFALAFSAFGGALSGMLGVGGGIVKVPIMHLLCGIPFRVAAANSAFMIGITASSACLTYLALGKVDMDLASPLVIGIIPGAWVGSQLLKRLPVSVLQRAFSLLIFYFAWRMWTWNG